MGTERDENDDSVHESSDGLLGGGSDGAGGAGLDELDAAILRHLERHGRATNYEVGEAVGLSASAQADHGLYPRDIGAAIGGGAERFRNCDPAIERHHKLPPDGRAIRLYAGGASGRHRRLRQAAPERVIAAAGGDSAGDQLRVERCTRREEIEGLSVF